MSEQLSYQFHNTSKSAWDAMFQAILGANKSIFWETYGLIDDAAGNRFIDALCEKARKGLVVNIIIDAIGSKELSSFGEMRLKSAGVKLVWHNKFKLDFRPTRLFTRLWQRNHRKILIVDEKIIFIGGVNVDVMADDWYDLHLKIEGEEHARPLLKNFARSYIRSGGREEDVVGDYLKTRLECAKKSEKKIGFIFHTPVYNLRNLFTLRRFYWRSLSQAKENFNLATPYYSPDARFFQLLNRAVNKGVKVNIILPWRPDYKFMQLVAHSFYELTRKAGAAIYFLNRMNHAKCFSVDNHLGLVGSVNLTPRSFFVNKEVCAYFRDEKMVGDLNNIFASWKNEAVPLSDVGWQKRGWHRRFREWWAGKISNYV